MKKVIILIMTFCLSLGFIGCRSGGGGNSGGGESFEIKTELNPVIWDDETHTIEFSYGGSKQLSIKKGSNTIATLAQDGSNKLVVTPVSQGDYTVRFEVDGETVGAVTVTIKTKNPQNPNFNTLQERPSDFTSWTEFGVHDPSLIEVDGVYYAFSTDVTNTTPGYQIRKSTDLLHWEYLQTAISFNDLQAADYVSGDGEFQEAFDWCKTKNSEADKIVTNENGNFSFWAPDVVKGGDGKFWLYFSLTGAFGQSRSCIGLAKADSVTGPYKFDSVLVKSPWGRTTPNAIDAQIFYEEGDTSKRMFMVYGSFFNGISVIELNPTTGRRKTEAAYTGTYTSGDDAYYGKSIAGAGMEGPVMAYHKDVPVYNESTSSYENKNFYYLYTSYGDLNDTYNMRSARSENIFGPYKDCTNAEMSANAGVGAAGDKQMGSYKFNGSSVDNFAPGHNDLFTTSKGINLVAYHARTNYFIDIGTSSSTNFHYLYLSQYAFNEDGRIVMNPNRYAGENLRKIEKTEITSKKSGKYNLVVMDKNSTAIVESSLVTLSSSGVISGAASGTWSISGDNYVTVTINSKVYKGVVMPAWIQKNAASSGEAGFTLTCMSSSGEALYLNSAV